MNKLADTYGWRFVIPLIILNAAIYVLIIPLLMNFLISRFPNMTDQGTLFSWLTSFPAAYATVRLAVRRKKKRNVFLVAAPSVLVGMIALFMIALASEGGRDFFVQYFLTLFVIYFSAETAIFTLLAGVYILWASGWILGSPPGSRPEWHSCAPLQGCWPVSAYWLPVHFLDT